MTADAIGAGPAYRVRVEGADWEAVAAELDDLGCALLPRLLKAADARDLVKLINLTEPGAGYTGGEFLLVEQRPRAQSRGTSTTLPYVQGLVFTTPGPAASDATRLVGAPVRHGVSVVRSAQRYTLGILFHDAP